MPGNVRTTYPTWHVPWACLGCEKHGEVFVRVTGPKQEWLRGMTRQIQAEHRLASPMCPHDISTSYATGHPKRPMAQLYGYRGPMVMGRYYRQSANTGQRIYAQGDNETHEDVMKAVNTTTWPPWTADN